MARTTGYKRILHRVMSVVLTVLFVLGTIPPMALDIVAADATFSSGAVYLDSTYSNKEVIIQNGVFSVTVNGATNITIIFDSVIMNRRTITDETGTYTDAENGKTIENLYNVSQNLNAQGKAQVCPFLITGNAKVTAQFRGTCEFYAGTNGSTVDSSNRYTASNDGCGYAGIQVQSGSTLIIDDAKDLTVFGGVQHAIPNADGNIKVGTVTAKYSDVLRANASISAAGYTDPFTKGQYKGPNGRNFDSESGGAGIGGGAWLNTASSADDAYTNGTPGTIIINQGNIEAWGGVQAAGIGGGVNSAATTGLIQINGGNITAHGGRFGAGIGDGDSVNGNTSTQYRDAHSTIEINGGNITVYGGVASPGIGSSDEISHGNGFDTDTLRNMEISINGGSVNAFSGFPKAFDGSNYPNDAPAAIGAGSFTRLPANSIYISSASTQLDASFSNYAITENGSEATAVPTINVDSDGYLFLLKMGNYHSTKARELVLYLPLTIQHPTSDGITCTIYEDQSTDTLYYIDDFGNAYDEAWNQLYSDQVPAVITLHVDPDKSQQIESIELAYYFRSAAITLPHPSVYGGLYALTVPVAGVSDSVNTPKTDSFISVTVDASDQGTQSGTVSYPSTHNLDLDSKAGAFTDLDVFDQGDTTNGLIGDSYMQNVYAYTVYIDAASTQAALYAKWVNNDSKIYLDDKEQTVSGNNSEQEATFTIDMSGVTQKTVRLKKIDNGYTIGAVSYKITIIKKGEYQLLFNVPPKTYDGKPITVVPNGVYMPVSAAYREIADTDIDKTPIVSTLKPATYGPYKSTMYLTSSYGGYWGSPSTYYLIDVQMTVNTLVEPQNNGNFYVYYIAYLDISQNSGDITVNDANGYALGWRFEYKSDGSSTGTGSILSSKPENLSTNRTWLGSGTNNIGKANGKDIQAVVSSPRTNSTNGGELSISCVNTTCTFFTLSKSSTLSTDAKVSTYDSVKNEVEKAIADGVTSGIFPYEEYDYTGNTHGMKIQSYSAKPNNNYPYSPNYENEEIDSVDETYDLGSTKTPVSSGKFEIYPTEWAPTSLPTADLEHIEYTFTRIKDADGNDVIGEASTPEKPVNAGTYRVDGSLRMPSYNAAGSLEFVISKRGITAVQIENWLLYISSSNLSSYDGKIADPGSITISNVVSGEDVTMTANGDVFYNDKNVGYAADKITIENPVLVGDPSVIANYDIVYTGYTYTTDDTPIPYVCVFGQIAYDMTGAMFKKTADGPWRKYLNASNDIQVDENNADYQSPEETDTSNGAYLSHAQYALVRTENKGSDGARYAIDIEYGSLQYSFHHSRWNVNTLEYEENELSYWDGNNGTNNQVTIINYSNFKIQYQISADIFFLYAPVTQNSTAGISSRVTTDIQGSARIEKDAWLSMDAATAGDHSRQGTAARATYYIYISGVPQMSVANGLHIGNVTLKFKPRT